jgi:hypothetical protein
MAVEGQASVHFRQPVHCCRPMEMPFFPELRAFSGHASMQLRHPMHRVPTQCTWIEGEMLSGLWHHTQDSGQPLKKTVLLMPGPSSVDMRWMRRMVPLLSDVPVMFFP